MYFKRDKLINNLCEYDFNKSCDKLCFLINKNCWKVVETFLIYIKKQFTHIVYILDQW
jgi:hypothetical protein